MQAKNDSLEVRSRTADGRTRRIEFLQNSSAPHCERTSGACRCIAIAYTVQLCCQADYQRCVQSTSHARPYPHESFGTPTDVCIVATLLHGLKRPAAPLGQCHGKQENSDKCGAEATMKPLCRSRHTNSNRNKKSSIHNSENDSPAPPHLRREQGNTPPGKLFLVDFCELTRETNCCFEVGDVPCTPEAFNSVLLIATAFKLVEGYLDSRERPRNLTWLDCNYLA